CTNPKSPAFFGGIPNLKRPYSSVSASSRPQFFKENGGLAITRSYKSSSLLSPNNLGSRIVSPRSIRWSLNPCKSKFILQIAHVFKLRSCPCKDRLRGFPPCDLM